MAVVNSFIKITLNDEDAFLMCNYKPSQKLNIILIDLNAGKAFSGYATDTDLLSQAAKIRMTFSEFISVTKKALIEIEPNAVKFLYNLEKNCSDYLFKWKSIDEDETIINIGSVKVTESDYGSTIKNAFLMLSEELLTLKKQVLSKETELTEVKNEKVDALQLLSDVTNMKEHVEKELYSKFVLVLNEKKEKIRELKLSFNDTVRSDRDIKKRRIKTVHQISESSDEGENNVKKMDVAGPSTSKQNNSLLFLDDDEPKIIISPSKQRIRNKTYETKPKIFEVKPAEILTIDSESEDELLNRF